MGGDRLEKRRVVGGVGATKPGGEYGDGGSAGVEAAAMCGRVDAVCAARDDDAPGESELGTKFAGEAECVFIRGAGADDGDRAVKIRKRTGKNESSGTLGLVKVEKS